MLDLEEKILFIFATIVAIFAIYLMVVSWNAPPIPSERMQQFCYSYRLYEKKFNKRDTSSNNKCSYYNL